MEWIKCEDRLPEDSREILMILHHTKTLEVGKYNRCTGRFDIAWVGSIPAYHVTHWCEITPPEDV